MYATEKGNTEIVFLLIEKGANINIQNPLGQTALSIAQEPRH